MPINVKYFGETKPTGKTKPVWNRNIEKLPFNQKNPPDWMNGEHLIEFDEQAPTRKPFEVYKENNLYYVSEGTAFWDDGIQLRSSADQDGTLGNSDGWAFTVATDIYLRLDTSKEHVDGDGNVAVLDGTWILEYVEKWVPITRWRWAEKRFGKVGDSPYRYWLIASIDEDGRIHQKISDDIYRNERATRIQRLKVVVNLEGKKPIVLTTTTIVPEKIYYVRINVFATTRETFATLVYGTSLPEDHFTEHYYGLCGITTEGCIARLNTGGETGWRQTYTRNFHLYLRYPYEYIASFDRIDLNWPVGGTIKIWNHATKIEYGWTKIDSPLPPVGVCYVRAN